LESGRHAAPLGPGGIRRSGSDQDETGVPMDFNSYLKAILHTDWISWIIHMFMFLILSRWSGIKWIWALILVLSIEIWETADWSLARPLQWWMRLDTYMDILSGGLGIWIAERLKRRKR
jgi:hypothetical protein